MASPHTRGCPWIGGYECNCGAAAGVAIAKTNTPRAGEGACPHGTRLTMHCYKCEAEYVTEKRETLRPFCETVKADMAAVIAPDRIGGYKTRKERPICTGVLDYFPDALLEVAHCSWVGNEQHNPGQKLHWAKEKSIGEGNEILRHLIDRGTRDSDGVRHLAKAAWRCLELLQREIDAEKAPPTTPWLTRGEKSIHDSDCP